MGTTFAVRVVAEDPGEVRLAALREAVGRVLARIDERMSTWRPESELSRFNRHRSTAPFPVSADTLAVFRQALEVSELTGGAFDVTVAPLVDAAYRIVAAQRHRLGWIERFIPQREVSHQPEQ